MSDNPNIESCDIVGKYGQCGGTDLDGNLILIGTIEFREDKRYVQNGLWSGATWELEDCEMIVLSGRGRPDVGFLEMEIRSFIQDTLIVDLAGGDIKYVRY